ncbi:hypothetical protein niasHT_010342 [Heterodera trifolii]|uniref:DNA-directed RNA polymerase subunit beta n=1 Tax=Heterodera trifolii TaxID=157864 RepID=A0ABD2M6L4_9BILA
MDCDIAGYHVESFNFFIDESLQIASIDVPAAKIRLPNGDAVEFSYSNAKLGNPLLDNSKPRLEVGNEPIFPAECRQRGITYRSPFWVNISLMVNGRCIDNVEVLLAEIPILLRSNKCNLHGLSREQLIQKGEEGLERGGYFVVNGSEKVVRLLVANKRNFPLALRRRAFRDKGKLFSDCAVMMRSIRGNHLASMMTLHYVENCSMILAIQFRRELFYVPLMYILKCLVDWNDAMIAAQLTAGRPDDVFWEGCVRNMLMMAQEENIVSHGIALRALGNRFRVALGDRIAPWEDDEQACHFLLHQCLAIHLETNEQKFFCLTLMAHKLVGLVKNEVQAESLDNPQFQEASVTGHILSLICYERMDNLLMNARKKLEIVARKRPDTFNFSTKEFLKALGGHKTNELTRGLEYFLATGNLLTKTGVGLMQTSGFSVIAERINQLRFVSHFRAIHRGAFFTEMRTTDVRKLRPEAWGFICPVHTPDGSPCGLLNHLTASAGVTTHITDTTKLKQTLYSLGLIPHNALTYHPKESLYPVVLDGDFVGFVLRKKAAFIERQLRAMKVASHDDRVPAFTELTLIRHSPDSENIQMQFAAFFIYSGLGRLMRPVRNLLFDQIEQIGIFEQVYLSIIIDPEEAEPGVTMHQELHPSSLFSFAGNLIPFPDHNQSPRNVYQCQMGKQTMGVPVHAWQTRTDNKMYKLQTAQKPLLKLEAHDKYEMDEYPLGTNACVAVISYTGYDMEDAMVINKASYQRGFAHGTVVKVQRISLVDRSTGGFGQSKNAEMVFLGKPNERNYGVGADGLPIEGRLYQQGDCYYGTFNLVSGQFNEHKFTNSEPAYCGLVRIVQEADHKNKNVHVLIQWRIQRNPIIGDKFASRHGQKGINSFLWPPESMPFSESGMVPDIIFNPHGFPSRMTIGMMIESMAGKAAAMHGTSYDASPFVFNEQNTAIEHFGKLLAKSGYNYYGNETMYSGIDGREMKVQIFFGIVYYQRLRHMIADKFQVRSTGPVDPITLQPIKGRKKGGGIRFGEMERDALIAHGTAFCLQDRLFNCSDRDEAEICARCGSIVSVTRLRPHIAMSKYKTRPHQTQKFTRSHCSICLREDQVFQVQVPRVFRYLCAELGAVNVKVQLSLSHLRENRH